MSSTLSHLLSESSKRVVKGFFVIRERPFLFPVNCEMANFFLVKRDLVTEREPRITVFHENCQMTVYFYPEM